MSRNLKHSIVLLLFLNIFTATASSDLVQRIASYIPAFAEKVILIHIAHNSHGIFDFYGKKVWAERNRARQKMIDSESSKESGQAKEKELDEKEKPASQEISELWHGSPSSSKLAEISKLLLHPDLVLWASAGLIALPSNTSKLAGSCWASIAMLRDVYRAVKFYRLCKKIAPQVFHRLKCCVHALQI